MARFAIDLRVFPREPSHPHRIAHELEMSVGTRSAAQHQQRQDSPLANRLISGRDPIKSTAGSIVVLPAAQGNRIANLFKTIFLA